MRRVFSLAIVVMSFILIGCCSSLKSTRLDHRLTLAEKLQRKTVALVMPVEDKLDPFCSGVWVTREHVITAAHCVENDMTKGSLGRLVPRKGDRIIGSLVYYVTLDDVNSTKIEPAKKKTVRKSIVVAYDKKNDIAVLIAANPPKDHTWAWIERDRIHVGEPVHAVGHVMNHWWTYHHGYVSMFRRTRVPEGKDLVSFIQTSAPVWKGASGCGLFNESGHLIGTSSFVTTIAPNTSFFVHRDVVLNLLKEEKIL